MERLKRLFKSNKKEHNNVIDMDNEKKSNDKALKQTKIEVQITDIRFGISELREFVLPQLNKDPKIQEFICFDKFADKFVVDYVLEKIEIKSHIGGDYIFIMKVIDDSISLITCLVVKEISNELISLLETDDHVIRIKR